MSSSSSSASSSASSSGSQGSESVNSDDVRHAADQFLKGGFLKKPITDCLVVSGMHARLSVVTAAMQGWRSTMEDCYASVLRTRVARGTRYEREIDIMGVFDGHAGVGVAKFLQRQLVAGLRRSKHFAKAKYGPAFRQVFLEADRLILRNDDLADGGSTAVLLVVDRGQLLTAWVGDSRCVICQDGRALEMTQDHTTRSKRETRRVLKAGSTIQHGRVGGALAMTRAFGDRSFKQNPNMPASRQAVVAKPGVTRAYVSKTEFAVLACDGIWEVMSSQAVVAFVRERLIMQNMPAENVCVALLRACIAAPSDSSGMGRDNMTVQLVVFHHGAENESTVATALASTATEQTVTAPSSPSISRTPDTDGGGARKKPVLAKAAAVAAAARRSKPAGGKQRKKPKSSSPSVSGSGSGSGSTISASSSSSSTSRSVPPIAQSHVLLSYGAGGESFGAMSGMALGDSFGALTFAHDGAYLRHDPRYVGSHSFGGF